jgi:curved DNA-binding protein CbpA
MARRGERLLDYYEILQVSPSASAEVIHAAYRALARAYHPDVNTSAATPDLMRRVNFAYETLKDPTRRAAYNLKRTRSMADRRSVTAPQSRALRPRPLQSSARREPSTDAGASHDESVPRGRVVVAALITAAILVILLIGVWVVVQLSDDTPTLAHLEVAVGGAGLEAATDTDLFNIHSAAPDAPLRSVHFARP